MRFLLSLSFVSLIYLTLSQTVPITHFDFTTYPDLNSILNVEPSQPKRTGLSNTIRYSLLLPDIICRFVSGKITSVKLIVPDGATELDFRVEIWRRQPSEQFELINTISSTFSTSGTKELLDSIDFNDKYMQFNDVIGVWLPWKYPVAAVSGERRDALFVARYIGPGSNALVQDPPEVGDVEPITSYTTIPYALALEVTLENLDVDVPVVLPVASDLQQVIRAKREVEGPTTLVYSPGVKGDKGDVGLNGDVGAQGEAGDPGEPGGVGDVGQTGQKGQKGSAGTNGVGVQGPPGVKGPTGATGPKGPIGVAGSPGPTGATGATGETGSTGPAGSPGPKGLQGDIGEKGSLGVQGNQGPVGDPGATGEKGAVGEQGPMGAQGANGAPGDNLTDQLLLKAPWCDANTCTNADCVNTLIGPQCVCNPGFEYKSATECQDVDECSQMGICSQGCTNTDGGFTCTCNDGFEFGNDSRTCFRTTASCSANTCASDETCHILTKGTECFSNSISISDESSVAQQISDVEFKRTSWANDEWVIVFIIWGVILTIIVIVTGVWLVYESRRSSALNKDYDSRSTLMYDGALLAHPPMSSNSLGRYNAGMDTGPVITSLEPSYPPPPPPLNEIYN